MVPQNSPGGLAIEFLMEKLIFEVSVINGHVNGHACVSTMRSFFHFAKTGLVCLESRSFAPSLFIPHTGARRRRVFWFWLVVGGGWQMPSVCHAALLGAEFKSKRLRRSRKIRGENQTAKTKCTLFFWAEVKASKKTLRRRNYWSWTFGINGFFVWNPLMRLLGPAITRPPVKKKEKKKTARKLNRTTQKLNRATKKKHDHPNK